MTLRMASRPSPSSINGSRRPFTQYSYRTSHGTRGSDTLSTHSPRVRTRMDSRRPSSGRCNTALGTTPASEPFSVFLPTVGQQSGGRAMSGLSLRPGWRGSTLLARRTSLLTNTRASIECSLGLLTSTRRVPLSRVLASCFLQTARRRRMSSPSDCWNGSWPIATTATGRWCAGAVRRGLGAELATDWLLESASRRGAVELFLELASRSETFGMEHISTIVDTSPTATIDRTLWHLAEQYGFGTRTMLELVIRRGADAPSRAVARAAAAYVIDHAGAGDRAMFRTVLTSVSDRLGFPRFMRILAVIAPPRSAVADSVSDAALPWLRGSPNAPEWASTWGAAYQRRYEDTWAEMEALGRAWLTDHPEALGWRGVVQTLALRSTRDGGWSAPEYVWSEALDRGYDDEAWRSDARRLVGLRRTRPTHSGGAYSSPCISMRPTALCAT